MKNFLHNLLDRTFWKFILVGMINTIVGTGVMFLFYNFFHLSYWISSASNYIVGSVVSYFLNRNFTFRSSTASGKAVPRFVLNIIICYLAAYGLARPLVARLLQGLSVSLQDNLAMLTGMCLFVVLNYLGQRFFVFRSREVEEGSSGPSL